jgi:hypothetical protein
VQGPRRRRELLIERRQPFAERPGQVPHLTSLQRCMRVTRG